LSDTSASGAKPCFFEQLAHQFHGCRFIAPSLNQQIENPAFVIDCAPEPEPPARNRHGHLVETPPRHWPGTAMAKFSGEQRPEISEPIAAPFRRKHPDHAQRADLRRRNS
jgi:hypothetical protein